MTSAWIARRGRHRSYPLSLRELRVEEKARAAAAVEAAAAVAPMPPLQVSEKEDANTPWAEENDYNQPNARHISFPVQVRFLSAVQGEDNIELSRLLETYRSRLNLNATNHQGLSSLHQAVVNRNLDSVKLLLFYGADCNIQDLYGRTPVHNASSSGFRQAVSLMIIYGADLFVLTYDGQLPIDVAKDNITTVILSREMTRQIQHEIFMDQYGFLFRGIEQWERFLQYSSKFLQEFWAWFKSFMIFYYQKAIGIEENS